MTLFDMRQRLGIFLVLMALIVPSDFKGFGNWGQFDLAPFSQKVQLEKAWFVVIHDPGDEDGHVSRLKNDFDLWAAVADLGSSRRFVSVNTKDADSYRASASEIGLPAYFLINGDNRVISSGRLPDDKDGVMRVVRQEQ
jgi:hypothetical protein